MAKRGEYQPGRMQDLRRALMDAEAEMDKANKWFMRLKRIRRHEIRLLAASGGLRLADVVRQQYRAAMKAAEETG